MSASALAVERVDFITVPTRDEDRVRASTRRPDGNWLILNRRYAPYE